MRAFLARRRAATTRYAAALGALACADGGCASAPSRPATQITYMITTEPLPPVTEASTAASTAAPEPAREPAAAVAVTPAAPARPDPVTGRCPPPANLPAVRTGGSLTVESPPRAPTDRIPRRLRTQFEGALTAGTARVWVGPEVPAFVPLTVGTMELALLESAGGRWLAVYRDPYNAGSCGLGGGAAPALNCSMHARVFDCAGRALADLPLAQFFSRPDHLELQDARFDGRVLYFNEACQTYAREAQGRCSALLAVDVDRGALLWRTPPLVSNNVFVLAGPYIVAGYGFTSERAHLVVVRRADGRELARAPLPSHHQALELEPGNVLRVQLYDSRAVQGPSVRFRLDGFDGAQPRLVPLAP